MVQSTMALQSLKSVSASSQFTPLGDTQESATKAVDCCWPDHSHAREHYSSRFRGLNTDIHRVHSLVQIRLYFPLFTDNLESKSSPYTRVSFKQPNKDYGDH